MPGRSTALALTCSVALACGGQARDTAILADAGSSRVDPLVHRAGSVTGARPAQPLDLADFGADELSTWSRQVSAEGVRFESPPLGPWPERAGRLRVRLAPAGAREVAVLPHVRGATAAQTRLLRAVKVQLGAAAPDGTQEFELELGRAVREGPRDASREGRLESLELFLPGASPQDVRLLRLTVQPEGVEFRRRAAGIATVDRDGILRPAWFTNASSRVRFEVDLPEAAPELRWHDSGLEGERRVSVVGVPEPLYSDATPRGIWTYRSVSLERWAGQRVTLELASREDLGFFGDPRIVSGSSPTPGVIVYMIDTLRADYVPPYRTAGPPLPAFERLAHEGLVFESALSSSSWTKPAVVTLLTGIAPTVHRVGSESPTDRLPASVELLQERFRAAGWRAGSFVANAYGSTLTGLERGFGIAVAPHHWRGRLGPLGQPSATQLQDALLEWLDEESDLPFFAFVHTLEVHEFKRFLRGRSAAHWKGAYADAVQAADAALGELLTALDKRGHSRDLLLVVVSDHGESFGEHGVWTHGTSLFQHQIAIPVILWHSGGRLRGRVKRPVGLGDLGPTILELAGLPGMKEADGISRVPEIQGSASAAAFVAASLLRAPLYPEAPRRYALVEEGLRKIIVTDGRGSVRFDLRADPQESRPLAESDTSLGDRFESWLRIQAGARETFLRRHGTGGRAPLTPEHAEQLRALGYVE